MSHQCPVCGFTGLVDPPADFEICPCCGTEFGFDDDLKSHAELRMEWVMGGMHWFSNANHAPPNWDPVNQLLRAGFVRVHLTNSVTESRTAVWQQHSMPRFCYG